MLPGNGLNLSGKAPLWVPASSRAHIGSRQWSI